MVSGLINENPVVYETKQRYERPARTCKGNGVEGIDPLEIYDIHCNLELLWKLMGPGAIECSNIIDTNSGKTERDIKDPEYPYTLEQLNVVSEEAVEVNDEKRIVRVTFTPTVEHCSMATVIGLCLRVKLMRSLPSRYKIDIKVAPGTHTTEDAVNKQLNDKERVAAAMENPNLLGMVDECLATTFS